MAGRSEARRCAGRAASGVYGLVAALVLMFVPPPLAPPRHGEEAIEQGVEQGEIALRLDQHRAQAEAQRLAVVQADMADALQGFEALGHGHAQPLLAQQAHEGQQAGVIA